MAVRTVVPFGPQHPVLPEPIHVKLELEDERVVGVVPIIGYIHRGIEKAGELNTFRQNVNITDRICGICSFIHGIGFSQGMEKIMNIEVPKRAQYLRVVWGELSRIMSHFLWIGLAADAIGFESLFMHVWRIRERIINIFEETTGGRIIFGTCQVGGVRKDIDNETLQRIAKELTEIEAEYKGIAAIFTDDYTIQHRWQEVGFLSKEDAYKLGAVGPTARASNQPQDIRMLKYGAYADLDFEPIVETAGDCYARAIARIREISQSIDLIHQAINKMPAGEIAAKITGNPEGEFFSRVEQPRGEVVYYLKANGTKFLDRFRVRTPTFANLPALLQMLKGCALADAPAIILSIDPCISCTER